MPLNVRRFYTSVLLVLVSFVLFAPAQGVPPAQTQTPQPAPQTAPQTPPVTAPTSGDIMRGRISKAKAYIAVRNYNAAIYELENIRKETSDTAVHSVVNVLLMNSYLEQGDYKRAQDLLGEFYTAQKTTKPNASASYMAVAGQIVKGARNRVERYRTLGLSTSDRTLPLEAVNDLEKLRETLELVITQSKEMGVDKAKTTDAIMLLEEASTSRSMLARDDYDARRWKDEVADTREQLASSRSIVQSAVIDSSATPAPTGELVAQNTKIEPPPVLPQVADKQPAATREREIKPGDAPLKTAAVPSNTSGGEKVAYVPSSQTVAKEEPKPVTEQPTQNVPSTTVDDGSPIAVGSLVNYATNQPQPIYPQAARSIRATGVVKVEVTISENGDVATIEKTSGPALLQGAAKDAIKKWRFKPFVRDGQPVKATGFVNFNFSL